MQFSLQLLPERRHQPDAPRPGQDRRPTAVARAGGAPRRSRPGAASISYTYTEPTIFYEYARDCARLATKAGLKNVFVTNGYMTAETCADIDGAPPRRQRRPEVVLRRVLPHSGGRAAEAGARLHPPAVRAWGCGSRSPRCSSRAERRRRRAARAGVLPGLDLAATSPGTCRASIRPTACSTRRPRRWRRWRRRCASVARRDCATSTAATSPGIRRSRPSCPRAARS